MKTLSERTAGFTDSVIRRMTRVSMQYGAINLSHRDFRILIRPERLQTGFLKWQVRDRISMR